MAIFISLQRTEPEYCNLTYFLHAADKPYPRLQESTVIVVNDDYTTCVIYSQYIWQICLLLHV